MTTAFWMKFWLWWLAADVAATFAVAEGSSIVIRLLWFGTSVMDWTLSDCIRRWARAHHWLPAVVVGAMALLCVHWFWTP